MGRHALPQSLHQSVLQSQAAFGGWHLPYPSAPVAAGCQPPVDTAVAAIVRDNSGTDNLQCSMTISRSSEHDHPKIIPAMLSCLGMRRRRSGTCSCASSASASCTGDVWSYATRLLHSVNAIHCKLRRGTGTLAKNSLHVEDLGDPHFACSCCPWDALAASCLLDHQCHLHAQAAAHALTDIDQHSCSICI